MQKIAIRAEGGVGDVLLFNRFIPAIKQKYPNSEITLYIDSEGKIFQKEVIEYLYPSFYKEIKIIPNKKYKNFWIKSQFGSENQKGFIENVPDCITDEFKTFDKFYDGHIDSLNWLNHDYDWYNYFRIFPKPEINPKNNNGEYICVHLASATSNEHVLSKFYISLLLKTLARLNKKIIIISTPETNHLYSEFENNEKYQIFNGEITEVCNLIYNSEFFIGTDSGFRYVAYGCGIPVITFSKQSPAPHQVYPSHQIRWLMFPELTFPLNFDAKYIVNLVEKIQQNKGYILLPFLQDFNNQAIKRNYVIDLEKTS